MTQKKAYWSVSAYVDKAPYAEVKDIDFASAEMKKKEYECALSGEPIQKRNNLKLLDVPEPSAAEMHDLLHKLSLSSSKPAVLLVSKHFQDKYIPEVLQEGKLPVSLLSLREDKYLEMDRDQLLPECKQLFTDMTVTEEQAKTAELVTKEHGKCKEWHYLRQGRLTASNMKAVCQGSPTKPAKSTVKAICGQSRFKTSAMQWGIDKEDEAFEVYFTTEAFSHESMTVEKAGFIINPLYPHIGASPDGLLSCMCCGDGVLEIKCPYSLKSETLEGCEFLNADKTLKREHKYMYQVQTQLLVSNKDYCDFAVWTEKECSIQRIIPDQEKIDEIIKKSHVYFSEVILPEIVGNLFTREVEEKTRIPTLSAVKETSASTSNESGGVKQKSVLQPATVNQATSGDNLLIICLCQKEYDDEADDVIGCDDQNCPYIWLHFKCVNIKRVPKGAYFCPQCKKRQPKRPKH